MQVLSARIAGQAGQRKAAVGYTAPAEAAYMPVLHTFVPGQCMHIQAAPAPRRRSVERRTSRRIFHLPSQVIRIESKTFYFLPLLNLFIVNR